MEATGSWPGPSLPPDDLKDKRKTDQKQSPRESTSGPSTIGTGDKTGLFVAPRLVIKHAFRRSTAELCRTGLLSPSRTGQETRPTTGLPQCVYFGSSAAASGAGLLPQLRLPQEQRPLRAG